MNENAAAAAAAEKKICIYFRGTRRASGEAETRKQNYEEGV